MPNWYQTSKEQPASRYYGSLSANILVPSMDDKEQEKEIAYSVLSKGLSQVEAPGDDASLDISIDTVESYG